MPSAHAKTRATIALFWILAAAVPLVCLELLSFALTKVLPDLFDQRQQVLTTLRPNALEDFKQSVASQLCGWDNPAGETRRLRNCVGEEIAHTYSTDRIRLHGSQPADAIVVVAGDSYTHGDEVADAATYPASLERILAVPVANLGGGRLRPRAGAVEARRPD